MIELGDLRYEIGSLDFATPPLSSIQGRASRNRKRRNRRNTAVLTAAFVSLIVLAVVLVSEPERSTKKAPPTMTVPKDRMLFYAADQANHSVDEFEAPLNGTLPTRTGSIKLSFAPGVVALSPSGNDLYVSPIAAESEAGSNSLYVVDVRTGKVVRKIIDDKTPIGSITVSPDGKTAYAWDNSIVPIDVASGKIGASFAPVQGEYNDLEISPNGETAITTCIGPCSGIQIIDLRTRRVTRTIRVFTHSKVEPTYAAFSANGTTAYVTAQLSEGSTNTHTELLFLDVATGTIYRTLDLATGWAVNVLVAHTPDRAFVFVQDRSPGTFDVVPVKLATGVALPTRISLGTTDGFEAIAVGPTPYLVAVDTDLNAYLIDETTGLVLWKWHIPVSAYEAVTLQPFAISGP